MVPPDVSAFTTTDVPDTVVFAPPPIFVLPVVVSVFVFVPFTDNVVVANVPTTVEFADDLKPATESDPLVV